MNTFTIEGWCKPEGATQAMPIHSIHFHVNNQCHLSLEQAEEKLKETHTSEMMVDVDLDDFELETSADCGPLSDCQLRVYLRPDDDRGQFHLVGHRASDGSLVYSNSVMVDILG